MTHTDLTNMTICAILAIGTGATWQEFKRVQMEAGASEYFIYKTKHEVQRWISEQKRQKQT